VYQDHFYCNIIPNVCNFTRAQKNIWLNLHRSVPLITFRSPSLIHLFENVDNRTMKECHSSLNEMFVIRILIELYKPAFAFLFNNLSFSDFTIPQHFHGTVRPIMCRCAFEKLLTVYLQIGGTGRTPRSRWSRRRGWNGKWHGRSCRRSWSSSWEGYSSCRSNEASCGPSGPRWSWKTRRSRSETLRRNCARVTETHRIDNASLYTIRGSRHCKVWPESS